MLAVAGGSNEAGTGDGTDVDAADAEEAEEAEAEPESEADSEAVVDADEDAGSEAWNEASATDGTFMPWYSLESSSSTLDGGRGMLNLCPVRLN